MCPGVPGPGATYTDSTSQRVYRTYMVAANTLPTVKPVLDHTLESRYYTMVVGQLYVSGNTPVTPGWILLSTNVCSHGANAPGYNHSMGVLSLRCHPPLSYPEYKLVLYKLEYQFNTRVVGWLKYSGK